MKLLKLILYIFMKKFLIKTLLWMWQFPQNFLAFMLCNILGYWSYYAGKYKEKYLIYSKIIPSSFSLGDYIFLTVNAGEFSIKHEYGHSIQSMYLGWFYLILIGVPSVLHNIAIRIARLFNFEWNYYSFFTERSANELGGVYKD